MTAEYWEAVPRTATPRARPEQPPMMGSEITVISEAAARGVEVSRKLIAAREKLFPIMREIYALAGCDGLMACALGVQLQVLREMERGGGK